MAWKCIRILLVVMMELLMLLLKCKATILLLPPSAWPILCIHSSKLDGVKGTLRTCYRNWERHCHDGLIDPHRYFHDCIVIGVRCNLLETCQWRWKKFLSLQMLQELPEEPRSKQVWGFVLLLLLCWASQGPLTFARDFLNIAFSLYLSGHAKVHSWLLMVKR